MACPHCGSWAVKADRSLAGRMVCGRCGRPLGRPVDGMDQRGMRRILASPRGRGWWGLLVLLLAISTALALLADTRQPPLSPPRWPLPGQSDHRL